MAEKRKGKKDSPGVGEGRKVTLVVSEKPRSRLMDLSSWGKLDAAEGRCKMTNDGGTSLVGDW
jgi:hypothetical protein